MNRTYAYTHNPITFDFKQTVERFFVEEVPLQRFTGNGNYLILKLKKKDMSTHKLITVIAKACNISERDIGYAGLKDKSATTIQYISLQKRYEKALDKYLQTERITILKRFYHTSPIKIGDLKGNQFSIKLYQVAPEDASAFTSVAHRMQKGGIPNYFGYQRFGEDGKSHLQGERIAQSGKRLKGSREKLLVSAYQSYLFNQWLEMRVNLSSIVTESSTQKAVKLLNYPIELVKVLQKQKQFFKLFLGDVMEHYPYGKVMVLRQLEEMSKEFTKQRVSPTGLLCGSHAKRSVSDAYHLEEAFDDISLANLKGTRRLAWIWPETLTTQYNKEKRELTVNFYLPKGAYATTLLEEIAKRKLSPSH
jgi:tRNA pseudouridine13 synthase